MTDLHKSRPLVWTLFLVFSIVWFYTLGIRTLVPTDEGRYAEMAREMVATGDWITTRLNGIKYFEKPPLQTWMNALTFELFGLGEWQARLWTGLCGFFGIVLVAVAGRKVFNQRIGFYAALVLASSLLWAALGHINTLDMGLSGMMTLALCALLIAQRDDAAPAERRNWMLACWAGMALAVLSKGLIGLVLPGAVLVIYTVIARDWAIWKRLHLGKGVCVFFAITVPWFMLVSLQNPEFPHFFFIHEHFERFLTKAHHREGPWYYFIPLLVLGIVPWLSVLVQSLAQGLREDGAGAFKPKRLLAVWAGFIFFFFSISSSKLPSYILPIFPALALLLAAYLDTASRKTWMATAGLVMAIGAVGIPFVSRIGKMGSLPQELPLLQAYQPWVMAACLAALAGGGLALWLAQRARRDWTALALAITGFTCGQLLIIGSEPHGNYRSGLPMVPAIAAELTPQTKLYGVGLYDQTLPFYLRRTMTLVEHQDELEFGLSQEPRLWIPDREEFFRRWTSGPKAIAITRPEIFAEMQKRGIPMRVLAQDGRRIAISNDLRN